MTVEELPCSSTANGTSEPASPAEASPEDRENANEWRLKGNEEFKSGFRECLCHCEIGLLPAASMLTP